MTASYYNEIDPFAAAWLRELIKAGHIAPGIVDERSIEDVSPNDLDGFTQCHFFAGIGVWSYALRQAGWQDDQPVWTGSCPCQSFSAAGKGAGFDDPRHLWPHFFRLIKECRPHTVFGEQVEAAIRHGWLDLVQADLERENYAIGAVVFPASGIGAPHIRSRLYWVADSDGMRRQHIEEGCGSNGASSDEKKQMLESWSECDVGRLADTGIPTSQRNTGSILGTEAECGCKRELDGNLPVGHQHGGADGSLADIELSIGRKINVDREDGRNWKDYGRKETHSEFGTCSEICSMDNPRRIGRGESRHDDTQYDGEQFDAAHNLGGLADSNGIGRRETRTRGDVEHISVQHSLRGVGEGETDGRDGNPGCGVTTPTCPTNGFWRDADWIFCRDGKWRPVESIPESMVDRLADRLGYSRFGDRYSLNPLIKKAENRVGRLRGYGNAIVAPQAQAFIEAFMSIRK